MDCLNNVVRNEEVKNTSQITNMHEHLSLKKTCYLSLLTNYLELVLEYDRGVIKN